MKKQLCISILITCVIAFSPFYLDPHIHFLIKLKEIPRQSSFVKFLQSHPSIKIAAHGYTHTCPICGSQKHEFYCPFYPMSTTTIHQHVDKMLSAFEPAGLIVTWVIAPGATYDHRFVDYVSSYDLPILEEGEGGRPPVGGEIVMVGSSVEFTWMWRNPNTATLEFQDAILYHQQLKPRAVNIHIQDFNEWTLQFLLFIFRHYPPDQLIVHDLDVTYTLELEQLYDLCDEYGVSLVASIIPTHKIMPHPILAVIMKGSWVVFLFFFCFINIFLVLSSLRGKKLNG